MSCSRPRPCNIYNRTICDGETLAMDCNSLQQAIGRTQSMKSLQLRLRVYPQNGSYPTNGSSVVPMGALTGIKVPHNCRIKWPASHGQQEHQISVFKTASKKLYPKSPSLSPQALSHTGLENGAEEAEVARPEMNADFPEEAIPTSSGYLPISAESKSRLFYVFYEATNNVRRLTDTPVVLWLNGGPGCSSLIGCFYELGPWKVNEKLKLTPNEGAWNRRSGLLFIDQPIGVGFSVAALSAEIPSDEYTVAAHLFYALQSWLLQNPEFRRRPIFLAGESYAGKYVPALAYYMLSHNSSKLDKFAQFAGMAIGNGLTDPRIQIAQSADIAFYLGLIDETQSVAVRELSRELVALIDQQGSRHIPTGVLVYPHGVPFILHERSRYYILIQGGQWLEANLKNLELVMYIYKASGVATLLDIRRSCRYHHREDGVEFLAPFLNSVSTRAALKVEKRSSAWVSNRNTVKKAMAADTMKSTKWMVEAVLRAGFPVLLYQGVYDARDGPACNEAWMRSIDWDQIKSFWDSEREVWRVNRRLAGYWRRWKNLSHVVVQGAGHQVPTDQPLFAQDMIERWMASSLNHGSDLGIVNLEQDQECNPHINSLVQIDII